MQRGRPQRNALQEYRNRDYCMHRLDDRHFDHYNEIDACSISTTGCLDALDDMPAGSMVSTVERPAMYDLSLTSREYTLAELRAIDDLINAIT